MARGRMVSKSISLDEKVNSLSDNTCRLLFTWLIPHLDSEGRMYGETEIFKAIVAPRLKISLKKIEQYLTEMEKKSLILRYSVNGNVYLLAPNFQKHQTGLRKDRESQSQIPPPTPDLLQSNDGLTPDLLPHKLSISKVKLSTREVEGTPTSSFISYKEKLRLKYPDLNIDGEWERCQIWYKDKKRKITSPSLALGNWMKKAKEIEGSGTDTRDNKQGVPGNRPAGAFDNLAERG